MKSVKMARLVGTILKSNFARLSRPYKLNFSVTYWCQSRCSHCSIWMIKPKGELTLDEIKELAKQNTYFQWVELTGGEPFLRNDIVEIAKAFKESSKNLYLLTMPTNSLCNYDMEIRKIEEIAQLGIPNVVITVSLDGYRELEDKIRGVPGNYDKAIRMYKGISELSKRYTNLIPTFGFTIINANAGQFERTVNEVMKEVQGISYTNFHVNIGQVSDNYYNNKNSPIAAPAELAMKDVSFLLTKMRSTGETGIARRAKRYLEIKYMEGVLEFLRTKRSPVPNRDGELSIFMDSYGNVFPSIMTSRKLGNIRQDGYRLTDMLAKADLGRQKEYYYTPCESYQSVLGSLLHFGLETKLGAKERQAVMNEVSPPT
jgi:MoaA/NifB/PqqE/SkfB family radical SAM enzyme